MTAGAGPYRCRLFSTGCHVRFVYMACGLRVRTVHRSGVAQASLKNWDAAHEDAKKCVEIKPDWPKGYSRLGGALYGKAQYEEAVDAYKKGLGYDAENATLKSGLKDAERALQGPGALSCHGLCACGPVSVLQGSRRQDMCRDTQAPRRAAAAVVWATCSARSSSRASR